MFFNSITSDIGTDAATGWTISCRTIRKKLLW